MAESAITLDELRRLVGEFPGPALEARTAAAQCDTGLLKPPGALGRLEALASWLAAWQEQHPPHLRRPRISLFAANHGVTAQGVAAYGPGATAALVSAIQDGKAAINQIGETVDADLRVYELDLAHPSADITQDAALSADSCAHAMAYGTMAAETGLDLLCLGELGMGNTTVAAALAAALFGGSGADWVGSGAGADAARRQRKAAAVDAALARHAGQLDDPLEALRRVGGAEFAAIAGAVIGARLGRIPVVLDGFAATVAGAVVARLVPGGLDHCQIGHQSAEPGHAKLLDILDRRPLQQLDMALGEGTGAALAIPVLRSAVACHNDMGRLAEYGLA